ncbi:MAG: phosphoribosylformylglycinamidine synthase subunit PurQ [Gemmatimonadales bacterium]|jgi:phosphoribosylformylglycinamidine synthase|nr:phosphoribosylformylglycinamidine synthase subunit PurQ [Gemmatimonadales bacterium]
MLRVAVVRFPGSNCDEDALRAAARVGCEAYYVWHRETSLRGADVALLPGGFSYGDYLRSGAIARFSPVMQAVAAHAKAGGAVIGVCNGFQILCEAHLLPGALMRNAGLAFVSKPVDLVVERTTTVFTSAFTRGARVRVPVAHGEGRFVAEPRVLEALEAEDRIVVRYAPTGPGVEGNPNGSANDIAGICSPDGAVVGLMPHPERMVDRTLGSDEGLPFFLSLAAAVPAAGGVR